MGSGYLGLGGSSYQSPLEDHRSKEANGVPDDLQCPNDQNELMLKGSMQGRLAIGYEGGEVGEGEPWMTDDAGPGDAAISGSQSRPGVT